MSNTAAAVTFVWPGDLHLETPDRENYRVAQWMVDDVNNRVRPDFVQFAGDNAQKATTSQFEMFTGLRKKLTAPSYALVGDHDAHHDPHASAYRIHCGEPFGAFSMNGYRFIRLNTMEFRPLGLTTEQVLWFKYEADLAVSRGEKIVIFQHHYPFQIWEDFNGTGIDAWREIVSTRPIVAIFAGHTHYGQIANDGHNVFVATRSIGDPEGGPAGYSIVHLQEDDLAVVYRSIEDTGPTVMITHPRDAIMATGGKHIVSGPDTCQVRTWSEIPVATVRGRIDSGNWFGFGSSKDPFSTAPIPGERLGKGEHSLEVEATDEQGAVGKTAIRFIVDLSGRHTAYPRVQPEVFETKFC